MQPTELERRHHPRTQAFVPIALRLAGAEDETPAHLLDLSCGGAALLTTAYNTPVLGQYLHVKFETPTNDGATESRPREELGVVVNIRRPERGIARVGVRFVHESDLNTGLNGPKEILDDHRSFTRSKGELADSRWSFLRDENRPRPKRKAPVGAS